MSGEEQTKEMTHAESLQKARQIIDHMEVLAEKGNALLLAYDSEKETFQMLAINADLKEVRALLMGCVASMQAGLNDVSPDRTLN